MQGTPLSKATCVATHSRTNKEGGRGQVAPGKQSILVLVIFFVQLPLLLALTHCRVFFFLFRLAVQFDKDEIMI